MKVFIMIGAISMMLSVALGAFGAHALKDMLTERMLANWQTGVLYQMVGGLLLKASIPQWSLAAWLMLAGIVFFSGSLYVMALTNVTKLGAITPIGGVLFIAAWIFVAIGAYKGL